MNYAKRMKLTNKHFPLKFFKIKNSNCPFYSCSVFAIRHFAFTRYLSICRCVDS